jgi:hypothetical protein
MKMSLLFVVLVTLAGCAHRPAASERSVQDIEQLTFPDAYRLWQREMKTLAGNSVSGGSSVMLSGTMDPATGKFTPSAMTALPCRLGLEAHLHESFLFKELSADAEVWVILESSPLLCQKYGIFSLAPVRHIPGQGYVHVNNSGSSPQAEQALWLKAMGSANKKPAFESDKSRRVR